MGTGRKTGQERGKVVSRAVVSSEQNMPGYVTSRLSVPPLPRLVLGLGVPSLSAFSPLACPSQVNTPLTSQKEWKKEHIKFLLLTFLLQLMCQSHSKFFRERKFQTTLKAKKNWSLLFVCIQKYKIKIGTSGNEGIRMGEEGLREVELGETDIPTLEIATQQSTSPWRRSVSRPHTCRYLN